MTDPPAEGSTGSDARFVVSDSERRSALVALVQACGAGRLTLDEFSRRSDVAAGTASRTDLVAVTADLDTVAMASGSPKRRWFVPVGNRVRRGRFVLPERTSAVVLMGEIHLDLRGATLVGPEPTIKLWVVMGNLRLLVPSGITVEVDQSSFLGGRTITVHGPPAAPDMPVLRVRMIDLMGHVRVTDDPAAWSSVLTAGSAPFVAPALPGRPDVAGLQRGPSEAAPSSSSGPPDVPPAGT